MKQRLKTAIKIYEKQFIRLMLDECDWDVPKTAKALGVGVSTLYRKVKELEIRK